MSTQQSEDPIDGRLLWAGIALVGLAVVAVVFDPVSMILWVRDLLFKAILTFLVSAATAITIVVIGGLAFAGILLIPRMLGMISN